jgi:hypothetical protein
MASDVPTLVREIAPEKHAVIASEILGSELRKITKKAVKRSYFDTLRSKIDSLRSEPY